MPEKIYDKTIFSLLEVTQSIGKTIAQRYSQSYWIKAEMNKLNYYKHSGHCYPELVEKKDGKIIAQLKAILWKNDYLRINQSFINLLNEPLKNGIKILFLGKISFDSMYGLSISIQDIDINYTLGDLEREKQETIQNLTQENLFNKNKILSFPLLPKRIAIISVETSNGYADFLKVIEKNPWQYNIFYYLFPSLLQGDKAIKNIITQLKKIELVQSHFDVVAIIRGGGGDIGLSCYNNYELCKTIASFPLPIITGIGHSTNKTVAEMVAYEDAITPTKLAEYILQKFHNVAVPIQNIQEHIVELTQQLLKYQHFILKQNAKQFFQNITSFFSNQKKEFFFLEKNLTNMSPENVLKRGYSLTFFEGKIITNTQKIKSSDTIETHLSGGKIISLIKKIKS
ncbi:MAG: exodeoxyribonuclease VII large subunit [Chitinophagaceae bacterium]